MSVGGNDENSDMRLGKKWANMREPAGNNRSETRPDGMQLMRTTAELNNTITHLGIKTETLRSCRVSLKN